MHRLTHRKRTLREYIMLELRHVARLQPIAWPGAVCEAYAAIEQRSKLFRAIGCVEPDVKVMVASFDRG